MNRVKITKQMYDKEKMYKWLVILCWLTILTCTILKMFGSKQFEMPDYTYNINIWIRRLINYIFYIINSMAFAMLLVKRKLKLKEHLIVIGLFTPLFIMSLNDNLLTIVTLLEFAMYFILGKLLIKDKWYRILIESVLILIIFSIYQAINMFYKNINIEIKIDNFVVSKIMMIDYYAMIILSYLYFKKKGEYIYVQIIRGWKRFLAILSNKRSVKKSLQQNVQEKIVNDDDKGFTIFTIVLSLFQFMLVFTLCYFINNTTWQFVIIFVSFCVLRAIFGKSYHCNSIITCTSLSCLVFVIATRLSLPPYINTM